jgi:LysM repeat protein
MVYQVYRVNDGDTLASISKCFNCSSDDLIRLNGISESDFVGDSYIVVPKNGMYFTYVVKKGDTLFDISNRYSIDLGLLYAINGLDDGDIIYPNQDLLIPNNTSMYLTKDGDTLSIISDRFNIDICDLVRNNQNLVLASDQIVVYDVKRD